MEFWASSEVAQPASAASEKVRRRVEPFLNAALAQSSLSALHCKLRYVPIIMWEISRAQYPARSKLRKKENLYDCAPQLNYDVFVEGAFEDQLREYIRGIALSAPYLAKLGASPWQIEEFETILKMALNHLSKPDEAKQ